jgi:hypothetical protein
MSVVELFALASLFKPRSAPGAGAAIGMMIVQLIVMVAVYLFWGFCMSKVFTKAGKPGIAGFVPIWNMLVMLEIAGKPAWWIILFFIPCVGIIMSFIVHIALAEKFGQSAGFGIGLTLLPIIFLPMLAFGSAQYRG